MALREADSDRGITLVNQGTANMGGGSATPAQLRPPAPPQQAPQSRPAEAAPPPAAPAGKRPPRKLILGMVLLAALGFGGYEGYNWWTDGRFLVTTNDAYVQADITVLAAKVPGYLSDVVVSNNTSVKAGDLLARIDDGDYRLALQSAQDKVRTQRSTVERIGRQIEAARAQVDQASAQVAQASAQTDAARADLVRAGADFERQQRLTQADYASRAKFDEAKAARDRADAAVKSAEAAVRSAKAAELQASANVEVLTAQQTEASRTVDELLTQVKKAERDLSFTEIHAPFDGVVGNKAVETGSYVQTGARLMALVPLTSVRIDANFKETQLAEMRPGQRVRIAVDAFPDRKIIGTVESVAPASGSVFSLLPADNATGNFTKIVQRVPVRVTIPADVAREGLLRPGLSVEVSVDTRGGAGHDTALAAAP